MWIILVILTVAVIYVVHEQLDLRRFLAQTTGPEANSLFEKRRLNHIKKTDTIGFGL